MFPVNLGFVKVSLGGKEWFSRCGKRLGWGTAQVGKSSLLKFLAPCVATPTVCATGKPRKPGFE